MAGKLVTIVLAAAAILACTPGLGGARDPQFGYELAEGTFISSMTTGPDGNLWFAATGRREEPGEYLILGKITQTGEVTEFPTTFRRGGSIASGPDGNLWFVETAENAIGRITTNGEVTSFPVPTSNGLPTAITAGPDGNLWFSEEAAGKIGRITPSGNITEFTLPSRRKRYPSDIVTGPDGSLWFLEREANWIGKITIDGTITEFHIPGPPTGPSSITVGPDGNLWFSEKATPKVGRITPAGEITQFTLPVETGTSAIVAGPGGKLWFAAGAEVGAISTSGSISWPRCLLPHDCHLPPRALAVGPDKGLWVGAGPTTCSRCGGGTALVALGLPGRVGRYDLLPLNLAIGPRSSPIRNGKTSVALACGQVAHGCRGLLRLGSYENPNGGRTRFRTVARKRYHLRAGDTRRMRVPITPGGIKLFHWLRSEAGHYPAYFSAMAGPAGRVLARRNIVFSFRGEPNYLQYW